MFKEEQNRGKPNWEHLNDELHVLITVEDSENRAKLKLERAVDEVKKLLTVVSQSFFAFCLKFTDRRLLGMLLIGKEKPHLIAYDSHLGTEKSLLGTKQLLFGIELLFSGIMKLLFKVSI